MDETESFEHEGNTRVHRGAKSAYLTENMPEEIYLR
jgi:hypothetical protein